MDFEGFPHAEAFKKAAGGEMRKKFLSATATVLICALVMAQEASEKAAPTQEQIKELIEALGSDTWKERTEAQKKLIEAGRAAGPLLEEAAKSDDMEVAHRAKKILDEICYLPDNWTAAILQGHCWEKNPNMLAMELFPYYSCLVFSLDLMDG